MSSHPGAAHVLLATVAALALVGCDVSSTIAPITSRPRDVSATFPLAAVSAREITTYNFRLPFGPITIFGWCTGEAIVVSGDLHISGTTWIGDESVRFRGHTNLNLAGIGVSTGRRYELQQITNSDQEFDVGTPDGTAQQVFHVQLISQGAAPNMYVTLNGTLRFSADGVEFIPRKSEDVCR